MNMYYFGKMNEYIEAGYAPTGRASCKGCKDKIEKQSVRLGIIMDDDHFNAKNWYHLNCFQLKPRFIDIDPEQQIYNLDHLDEKDYDIVLDYMKKEVLRLKEGKKPTKSKQTGKPKVSKKKKQESQQEQKSESSDVKDEDYSDNIKKSKSKAKGRSKSVSKSKSEVSSKSQDKKKKKVKKQKLVPSGYTNQQKKQFKQLTMQYFKLPAEKLKQILALNNQSKTGNKTQLSEKCADGKILGKIPNCSSCGGGKLRFNRETGIYKCPGYMDDDEFKNCNKTYGMNEIVREPWVEP